MSQNAKISIIVPIYNTASLSEGACFLRRCVASIINQTYQNIEIVFVDNNSSDDSIDVVRALVEGDSRVTVAQENQPGVSCARNKGLSLVSGDYFTFVDSDDHIGADYIKKAVDCIHDHRYPDLLLGDFLVCLPDGSTAGTCRTHAYKKFGYNIDVVYPYIECVPNIFFKTDLMKENKISYDTGISIGEDNLFNARAISAAGSVVFVDSNDYFYKVHESSSSRAKSDKYLSFIEAYREIFSIYFERFGEVSPFLLDYVLNKRSSFSPLMVNAKKFDRALVSLLRGYGIEDELPRLSSERRLSDRIIKLLISLLPHQELRKELRRRFLK